MARHVLLIEPDVDTMGKLAEELRARGMVVSLAGDLGAAVERARVQRPHVLFVADSLVRAASADDLFTREPEFAAIPRVVLLHEGIGDPDHATYEDVERLVARALEVKARSTPPETSQGELRGDLGQVPLVDLLQLFVMNRRTGVLIVSTPAGAGELRVADGEVLDAIYRRLEGEKAFYRLLSERVGTFSFQPGSPPAIARLTKGTSTLLMESMRHKDEVARIRDELGDRASYVVGGEPLLEEADRNARDVYDALSAPRSLDDLLDEVPAPDLEVLQTLLSMLASGVVRRVDGAGGHVTIAPPEQMPVLRALAGRLAREGFAPPARFAVASTPRRIQALAGSLLRVTGASAPAEPIPGAPIPHDLGVLRLGDAVELGVLGVPVVDAFAPTWSLALPGVLVLVRLDETMSPTLDAVCRAFELRVLSASDLVSGFDEADPAKVAELVRAVIEQSAAV
jgi:hypothetical protein